MRKVNAKNKRRAVFENPARIQKAKTLKWRAQGAVAGPKNGIKKHNYGEGVGFRGWRFGGWIGGHDLTRESFGMACISRVSHSVLSSLNG